MSGFHVKIVMAGVPGDYIAAFPLADRLDELMRPVPLSEAGVLTATDAEKVRKWSRSVSQATNGRVKPASFRRTSRTTRERWTIALSVTAAERAAIVNAAFHQDTSFARFIRDAALKAARR